MAKEIIRLNETVLENLITKCLNEALEENDIEEGVWNNVKTGVKSAFGKGVGSEASQDKRKGGGINLKKRWNAAKQGYNSQDIADKIDNVVNYLKDLIEQGKIDPNQTVQELVYSVGGRNKFGRGNLSTMRAQANAKASKAQNDIYRNNR